MKFKGKGRLGTSLKMYVTMFWETSFINLHHFATSMIENIILIYELNIDDAASIEVQFWDLL